MTGRDPMGRYPGEPETGAPPPLLPPLGVMAAVLVALAVVGLWAVDLAAVRSLQAECIAARGSWAGGCYFKAQRGAIDEEREK